MNKSYKEGDVVHYESKPATIILVNGNVLWLLFENGIIELVASYQVYTE